MYSAFRLRRVNHSSQSYYLYNDNVYLEYAGAPLEDIIISNGRIALREIGEAEMEAYRIFNAASHSGCISAMKGIRS